LWFLQAPQAYYEKHGNADDLYNLYYEYSTIYYTLSDYENALEYNQKCIDVLKTNPKNGSDDWKDDMAAILQVMAYVYTSEEKYDSSQLVLERGIELCEDTQETHACHNVHIEMGKLLRMKDDYSGATYHYNEGLKYAKRSGTVHYLMNTYQGMSNLEVAKGNYKLASQYFARTNELYEEYPDVMVQADFYKFWADVENEIGNYKRSNELYIKHYSISDSILSKENREIVADLEEKYKSIEKDKEIISKQLEIEKKSSQRNLFLGLGLFSLLGVVYFWNRNRHNKQLSSQQSLIHSQKIDQLEKEKKLLSMNAMIEGQEAERVRIAKDLHDGLGGMLSTVKAHFSNIQSEIQKIEKIDVYNKANELVDEACDEVRRISHNLMPGALRLEGLKSAVEHLGEEMDAAHPFVVKVEAIGLDTRMDESKEVFVFRIIQEALNNIIKHANASEVLIQMSETADEYHFIVEDDGNGFDPLQIQFGLGLKSIQSRVDFLKGKLDVDTRESIGTTLSWHIPKG